MYNFDLLFVASARGKKLTPAEERERARKVAHKQQMGFTPPEDQMDTLLVAEAKADNNDRTRRLIRGRQYGFRPSSNCVMRSYVFCARR